MQQYNFYSPLSTTPLISGLKFFKALVASFKIESSGIGSVRVITLSSFVIYSFSSSILGNLDLQTLRDPSSPPVIMVADLSVG